MDAPGSAPPILFEYNGKFYVSFVSTGLPYFGFQKRFFYLYLRYKLKFYEKKITFVSILTTQFVKQKEVTIKHPHHIQLL